MLVADADGVEDQTNPDILEVINIDYDDNNIQIATIDPKFNDSLKLVWLLKTKVQNINLYSTSSLSIQNWLYQ